MKTLYTHLPTHTTVDLCEYTGTKSYCIQMVKTQRKYQGQGGARLAMSEVLQDADREQVTLLLEILPSGGRLNHRALTAWYQRLGFRQEEQSNLFIRQPKPLNV